MHKKLQNYAIVSIISLAAVVVVVAAARLFKTLSYFPEMSIEEEKNCIRTETKNSMHNELWCWKSSKDAKLQSEKKWKWTRTNNNKKKLAYTCNGMHFGELF
jgi:hypothetical protein